MSVYSKKGKGWRYDFTLNGERYTEAWFPTKAEAKDAMAIRRKEVMEPEPEAMDEPIDMGFLELVNRRLDYVKAYRSERHYDDSRHMAKRWVRRWGKLRCSEITRSSIQRFVLKRSKVSRHTANKEIRYLRATFNFGKKQGWSEQNPTDGIEFLPVEKKLRFLPELDHIDKVIQLAETDKWLRDHYPDTADYLWTIRETMGRMSEVNSLRWDDVNFKERFVILYTRKKKGGHLSPRKIPMTQKLFEVLSRRFKKRKANQAWVFVNRRTKKPYGNRKRIMKRLCKKAKVPYFRFHALRHLGASVMDNANVPMGSIQRILGHENRQTTEIYLHGLSDLERRAIEIYEQARQISHTDSHTGNGRSRN